ncbi:cation-translocating P-type ATPase [Sphingobium indicum]|uniref:Cation-translocating P-type ATPase n=1 Tax=Sphingobium indicum TaxID=332055 RepID=A0A4Q4J7D4_9SPHN|nr:cation-translocating P-type ATPase [Sphingobium indicum]NYI22968.1 Ca2+-transporting ATPase [Sphingobium indicum]RYM01948.1 cation-translocating P-type ATPase [Sphingobium indicum]
MVRVGKQLDHAGLSASQARERLAEDGPNELPRPNRRTPLRIAAEVLREPMFAMLLAAGIIYLLLGDRTEASVLLGFAGLSILITIVQEARTERTLEALRDLSAPRALVIRDNETVRVPGPEVVHGDMLVLEAGDRVAADALVIEAQEMEADESLLTGEAVPVRKRTARTGEPDRAEPGGDDTPYLFSGAVITHGRGIARVSATGLRSRIGQVGRFLETLETEVPHLQKETARIVGLCAIGGVTVALLVVLLYGGLRGDWMAALLAGVATAMSLLPEEFPVVLTIFLAMGAWRIAQVGVLTRRASAVEALGAATALCTDKTGTLTQNRMTVTELWLPSGETVPLGDGLVLPEFHALIETAALASAPVPVDPMEVAFHGAARDARVPAREGWQLVHTNGLRPDLLAMSNLWRTGAEGTLAVAAKGAPEAIARLCRLDAAAHQALDQAVRAMAARGIRVLGVASATIAPEDRDKGHEAHDFSLLGLVGLSDPLRAGVPEAIAQCAAAGVRVVMITGDYPATAQAIAAQAGIASDGAMTGDQISALSDTELAEQAKEMTIFARIMPEQKLRIVSALKAAGEVVAMTGDGVNDAPALKAAHIGIAMGKRGTDVAREAAAIVLVEDDFGAIVVAIRLGRRIYDNIRKAIGFIFAVHVPIAGLALSPLLLGLPLVLGPIQIALLEMIIDPVCALVFEAERAEQHIMRRPPRNPAKRLFSMDLIVPSVLYGGIAFALLLGLHIAMTYWGFAPDRVRTVLFFGLVASIMALVLVNRSFSTSLTRALWRNNASLRYMAAAVLAACGLILTLEPLRRLLHFSQPDPADLLFLILLPVLLLLLCEGMKGWQKNISP